MMKRYQQNQELKIKEQFREHPFYKLCKTVFKTFQEECPTMVMTPERLFVDAAQTLDRILCDGDVSTEMCQDMWTDKYTQYRENDEKVGGKEDATKTEVAVLFYVIMLALQTVNLSHYRATLQRTLHDSICKLYGFKECLNIERKLHKKVNQHTSEMMAWMADYFVSTQSLTAEIDLICNPNRKAGRKESIKKCF